MSNFILENRLRALENCDLFFGVFRVSLKRFWDNITGFDIIAFDAWLQGADSVESAESVIRSRYGEEGVRLIRALLGIPEERVMQAEENVKT